MSEFRVEKVKRSLDVVLSNGHKMSGTVFLEPVARHHAGEQDIRELLNDDDEFFPFLVNNQLTLLAKDQVKTATYRAPVDPTRATGRSVAVKVIMSDGNVVSGSIEMEARSHANRLLDFLNAFNGRYLAVAEGTTHCLVNRRMIAGVQQR
jgi:hypothetical protein